jgi:hypothetical protein
MRAKSFARLDGLGVAFLPCCTACRMVLEPLLGVILTVGLAVTLTLR